MKRSAPFVSFRGRLGNVSSVSRLRPPRRVALLNHQPPDVHHLARPGRVRLFPAVEHQDLRVAEEAAEVAGAAGAGALPQLGQPDHPGRIAHWAYLCLLLSTHRRKTTQTALACVRYKSKSAPPFLLPLPQGPKAGARAYMFRARKCGLG